MAAARAVAPSLVRETGVITSVASALALAQGQAGGHYVYFDGNRLWVNQGRTWLAIDPESRETVAGPILLDSWPRAIAFDGHQLWFLIYDGLQSIDVDAGKLGSLIKVEESTRRLPSLVYDGKRLWFPGKQGLQSIDPVSRQISPPIVDVGNNSFDYPCMAIVDDTHEFLWFKDWIRDKTYKIDLKQNKLLNTPVQDYGLCPAYHEPIDRVTPWIYHAEGLWIYDGTSWRLFDTQTGSVKASTPRGEGSIQHAVLASGRLWVTSPVFWTLQSFDAVTGQPDPPIPLLGVPGTLAFDGKRLWIMLFEPGSGKFQGLQYIVPNEPAANIVPPTQAATPAAEAKQPILRTNLDSYLDVIDFQRGRPSFEGRKMRP